MFGRNKIVGRKFFANARDKLMVTSVFYTLQGEGPYAGRPAVFVRLSKCNLACDFCDTTFERGDWINCQSLASRVRSMIHDKFAAYPDAAHRLNMCGVVITGGEPTLQINLGPFCDLLRDLAFVQIESNGTLYPTALPTFVTLVVSPKVIGDGQKMRYFEPMESVQARADCLKFVVSGSAMSPYYGIPQWAFAWRDKYKKPIYISPMNVYADKQSMLNRGDGDIEHRNQQEKVSFWEPGLLDMKQVRRNHEFAGEYAMRHGLFLSLQQHIYIGAA